MAVPELVHRKSPRDVCVRPVLLPMASYHGTLAAVRSLGAAGVPVTLAESSPFVPAVWSRFAARRVRSPSPENPDAFIEWLIEFGAREPGYVLYPTSDDVAWLYARHRQELARSFVLRYPDAHTTYALLNKTRLRLLAEEVGLRMPRTWIPASPGDLEQIEREARFPVVVKPQTQVLLRPHAKGMTVDRPSDLRHAYEVFTAKTRYSPTLLAHDPGVSRATVQEYFKSASEDVYGITGFVDDTGRHFAARASRKILQHPRRLGVGLCFAEAELDAGLLAKVVDLCRRARFHGVFEAEFVSDRGMPMLIDFNPRFYGQMAFDVARGLPQPLLAYEWTLGRNDRVEHLLASARSQSGLQGRAYCRERDLKLLLVLRRLAGSMSRDEASRWSRWLAEHRGALVDGVFDPGDRRPAAIEVLRNLSGWLRHPRSFIRQWMFD